MTKKVAVISGFNGFIGQNLGFVLKMNGFEVAPMPREVLLSPKHVAQFLLNASPTHIFHLASYGNHSDQKGIDEIITTNYLKSFFLLKEAERAGVENFINFSSSSVYGTHDRPLKEDTHYETNTFYGATKLGFEYLVNCLSSEDMKTVNIRPFSVYGEGEALHRFIPTIFNSIINNKELTLYEKPVHDWIFIEDFLSGVMTAVNNIDKLNGKAINIGTGKQYTNKEVYETILKITGGKPLGVDIKDSDRDYDTTESWVADNTLLKSLGWEQLFSLEGGLKETYEYYKKTLDLEATKEKLVGADTATIMDTLANKFGSTWEDLPEPEDPNKIII